MSDTGIWLTKLPVAMIMVRGWQPDRECASNLVPLPTLSESNSIGAIISSSIIRMLR